MVNVSNPKIKLQDSDLRELFYKGCSATLQQIDSSLADIIAQHVRGIMTSGFSEGINPMDFFHGHVRVFRHSRGDEFTMPLEENEWLRVLNDYGPIMIYHTRERTGKFKPYKGPPRSIAGTIDGRVFPMRSYRREFQTHGTVIGYESFEFDGKNHWGCYDHPARLQFRIGKERLITTAQQIYILIGENVRYNLADGTKFDVFYELTFS